MIKSGMLPISKFYHNGGKISSDNIYGYVF